MYQQHFGMHTDPFPLTPKLAFVYPSRAFGETMAHLVYGIEQAEDIILITGGIGTGKTLALNNLLSQIQRVLEPVLVNVTRLTFPELLKYVLLELGETVPGSADTPDLLQQLKHALHERRQRGRKVLLIVDEAQHLTVDTLESLRLLLNLSAPEEQCLQLVLVGQPALEEAVGRRELAQLSQRIRVRYRIEPLSRQEVEAYLDHRVRVAGCTRHLFRPGAIDRIYALSQGIPRVVNILASRALLATYVAGKAIVEPSHVRSEDLPPVTDGPHLASPAAARVVAPVVEKAMVAPEAPEKAVPPLDPRPEATPTEDHAPYLMWPPRSPERSSRRKLWLGIGLPVILAVAVVSVWQWPNLASTTPTRLVNVATQPPVERPVEQPFVAATPVDQPAVMPPSVATQTTTQVADTVAAPVPRRTVPAAAAVVERERPAVEPTPVSARAGELAVHVGSFHDAERAERLLLRLTGAGFAAYAVRDIVDGEPWVRVYAGPYATQAEAAQARDRLTEGGVVAYARIIPVAQ